MTLDANAIFETELLKRGFSFAREDENVYEVQVGDWKVSASLSNVRRDAEREHDPAVIIRFVDHILGFSPNHQPWSEASALLFWSAEPSESDFGETIRVDITDEVSRVLTVTDASHSTVTWVTPAMCDQWDVTVDDACAAAFSNQNGLLDGLELETEGDDVLETLGMIPVHPPYKASTIFASSFKNLVAPALGWPVLVVLPCRDFIYVIANASTLLDRLGQVVVDEFRKSGYPITTEVLRISDDGIEAIGRFPT